VKVEHVEVLVEEPSAEAALLVLLLKILGNVSFAVHPHEGKSALLKHLPGRLKGYKPWLPANSLLVIVVDCDDDDCARLKSDLERMAANAGLVTRTRDRRRYAVVNRLAIEELEAWYFGDWEAVRNAYPRVPASIPTQVQYRDPDAIKGGTWEAFERVLQKAGYFTGGLRKIEAARAVAAYMDPARNRSPSFRKFCSALAERVRS
jgi:hypothetical protein